MSYLAAGLLVVTLVSVISLMIPACQGAVCNQSGWFGKDSCLYKCHCANDVQCDFTTGECSGRCAKGWFGPQCQYVDLTSTQSTTSSPSWLYDGNDNTCNTDTSVQTVTIQLKDPLPITWLRLSVNNPGNLGAFTLTFKTKTGDNTVTCNNMKTGNLNDKTLDIHCELSVEVQEVILTGDGVKSLCSVYISGDLKFGPAGRNVALKQSVSQTTIFGSYGPARAIDGNTDGDFSHGSCSHTQPNFDFDPTWTITFILPQMINRYILYNRQDAVQSRLQYFMLSSFDESGSQVFHYQDDLQQPQPIYTVTSTTSTSPIKKITIKATRVNIDNDYTPVLTLCEVEAYGDTICEDGKYGRECEQSCDHCLNNRCFVSTGWCINGCVGGYFGYTCDEQCNRNCKYNACDPSTKQCTQGCKDGWYGSSCDQACNTHCKDDICDQDTGNCHRGCDVGFYGPKCENACSVYCVGNTCEQDSGTCSNGCKDGYNGTTCEIACPHPTYGKNCAKTCSTYCTDQKCNYINGKCDLCIPGKTGDQCDQECPHPTYGQNCSKTCSVYCKDQECNKVNGTCFECRDGKTGDMCNQDCNKNCKNSFCDQHSEICSLGCNDGFTYPRCDKACPHPTYGPDCTQTCSINCTAQKCDNVDGKCDLCIPGTLGDMCNQECNHPTYGQNCSQTCSTKCVNQVCKKIYGTCDRCPDGWTGDQCDQACPHPTYGPDCTQTCSINCTGQRCNNVDGKCDLCVPGTLGDMCEQECRHPTYGQNCSQTCSTKCVNQECNKINGICDRCPAGWTGDQCDQVCPDKTYGERCKKTCSIYCTNQVCDPVNGTCDHCVPGKLGVRCDQDCPDTTYGMDCNSTCSIKCKDRLCDTVTGSCKECYPGKRGGLCEEVCPDKTYGEECKSTCSIYCMNEICDPVNGTCNHCVPGKLGDKCDQDCPATTYGQDCKATCSVNCVGQLCDTITGKCINCPPGYRGEQCEEECPPGKYGPGCTQTCNKNCYINATHYLACNIDTGICLQGCFSGYTGLQCESKISEDSSADFAVGAGVGVGVSVLVCIIGISVYCYWRRSSRVARARRQRPPGYEETVMNGQDEHQYRELFKSSDGYNLPTDATSAELSTPRSRSRITVTENTTTPYMNADVGHYEDITEIGNMDGATGDTLSIGDVTTSLEKGRNNDGYTYANC